MRCQLAWDYYWVHGDISLCIKWLFSQILYNQMFCPRRPNQCPPVLIEVPLYVCCCLRISNSHLVHEGEATSVIHLLFLMAFHPTLFPRGLDRTLRNLTMGSHIHNVHSCQRDVSSRFCIYAYTFPLKRWFELFISIGTWRYHSLNIELWAVRNCLLNSQTWGQFCILEPRVDRWAAIGRQQYCDPIYFKSYALCSIFNDLEVLRS